MELYLFKVDEDGVIVSHEFYLLEKDEDKDLILKSETDYIVKEVTKNLFDEYESMILTLDINDIIIGDFQNYTLVKKNKLEL